MRIDSHQHYWEPRRGDYDWMPKDNPILYRRYRPADLEPHLERNGIDGTVVVQAAESVHETEYLLGIADASDSVLAVVGWVDFENPADRRQLERLSRHPKLAGVRPLIQDIPDVDWMLRDDVQWAYRAIIDVDLTFDALGFPPHLDNFLTIFRRYPDLRAVIDHCMKPRIRDHRDQPRVFDAWAAKMSRFAGETDAYCKLSGLVTESNESWTVEELATVRRPRSLRFRTRARDVGLRLAGVPEPGDLRRLVGSVAGPHQPLDEAARDAVFGGTAAASIASTPATREKAREGGAAASGRRPAAAGIGGPRSPPSPPGGEPLRSA